MRSQEAFHLLQSARAIGVTLDTDGDRVGGLLNEQHSLPVDEGDSALDYRRNLRQLSSRLDAAIDGVVAAEDVHSDQLILLSRGRDERDEIGGRAYGKLVSARQGLEGLFKRGGYELAFVSGEIPRAPKRLCEQLEQSAKLLRRPVVKRRKLRVRGFRVDLDEVADELETLGEDLRAALDRVDAARKEAEGTLLAKRKALKVLRRTVVGVGRTAEGLFHLAGEDELAKRMRAAMRRRRRASKTTEESAPEGRESEGQVSETRDSEGQVSEIRESEPQASEPQASEPQASETRASEGQVSETRDSELRDSVERGPKSRASGGPGIESPQGGIRANRPAPPGAGADASSAGPSSRGPSTDG